MVVEADAIVVPLLSIKGSLSSKIMSIMKISHNSQNKKQTLNTKLSSYNPVNFVFG